MSLREFDWPGFAIVVTIVAMFSAIIVMGYAAHQQDVRRDSLVADCVKAGRPVLDCKAMVGR